VRVGTWQRERTDEAGQHDRHVDHARVLRHELEIQDGRHLAPCRPARRGIKRGGTKASLNEQVKEVAPGRVGPPSTPPGRREEEGEEEEEDDEDEEEEEEEVPTQRTLPSVMSPCTSCCGSAAYAWAPVQPPNAQAASSRTRRMRADRQINPRPTHVKHTYIPTYLHTCMKRV